jgi:hypothetical protein
MSHYTVHLQTERADSITGSISPFAWLWYWVALARTDLNTGRCPHSTFPSPTVKKFHASDSPSGQTPGVAPAGAWDGERTFHKAPHNPFFLPHGITSTHRPNPVLSNTD